MRLSRKLFVVCVALLAVAAGCSSGADQGGGGAGGAPGKPGDFVSADAYAGQRNDSAADAGLGAAGAGGGAAAPLMPNDPREVVEGDIYRVLDRGALLNLNSYRGLQVIDIANPTEPAIVGRYGVLGTPVEMYTRGSTAFVLLNDWHGYYGSREDVAVKRREGGLLVRVDISDRTAPREVGRVLIAGSILTSRVVQNDTTASIYIASTETNYGSDPSGYPTSKTIVTSFDIAGAQLVKRGELDLGGYVKTVQATPTELLVASEQYDGSSGNVTSTVAIIDISDPAGAMVYGDSVQIPGMINNQFNLDLYNGVLRVVSTSWNGDNQVQTFAADDVSSLKPLHTCTFGQGMQLYATLFLENKAFFVTYLRQDPFHAFEIGDDGSCVEKSEFVVSGWNDYFRPVSAGTRLIGVGTDEINGETGSARRPAVSLYDITSLSNTNPLVARAASVDLSWSWSEAMNDHRAFSVIEGAVSVPAADGTEETGLVLLPYAGSTRSADGYRYVTGVSLFTFSDRTVTERGRLDHSGDVRRTFLADSATITNLSDTSLSLYDHSDPTAPELLGELDLAPAYARVLRFGDYVARAKRASYEPGFYEERSSKPLTIDIVPADGDLNIAEPLASFEVPNDARLLKSGDLLVSISQGYVTNDRYTTKVQLFDLSNPSRPRAAGSAETDDLVPTYFGSYGSYWGGGYGFVGCGMGLGWFDGSQADGVFALGDRVVFIDARGEEELLGEEETCHRSVAWREQCHDDCTDRIEGFVTCTSLNGGREQCTESLASCDWIDGIPSCEPVALEEVEHLLEPEHCYTSERHRYWSRYAFKALDVSDPDAPVFGELERMPRLEEGVSVLPAGDALYYTYQRPVQVEGDPRPHVGYRFKKLTFDDVSQVEVGPSVSVPGELLAVDGSRAYTKDIRWGERVAETYVHEIALHGDYVTLEASERFEDREVTKVVADGDRIYVTHRLAYGAGDYYYGSAYASEEDWTDKLAVYSGRGLELDAEVAIDSWSTLEAVHGERALFTIPSGLLMVNVEDSRAPYAQAFFDSNGWPEQILFEAGEVVISAGHFGIYRFDAATSNLLSD